MNFFKEVQWGLSFCCVPCQREMFKRGVKNVTRGFLKKIENFGLIHIIDFSKKCNTQLVNIMNVIIVTYAW